MALTKEQIDILSDKYIVSLYSGMEQEIINDIARRINKAGRYTETAEIQARNMRELGFSTAQIQAEAMKKLNADPEYKKQVALDTKQYKQDIKNIISDVVFEANLSGDNMIAAAGTMSWNDDLQMWSAHGIDLKKNNTLKQLQEAFVKQTKGDLKNITQTTAFVGTPFGNTGVQNAYQKALDMTVLKVATGTVGYKQAIVDVIKDLSHGLSTVDYASGRKYHIDTAARMTARTACSQLAGKITEQNIKDTGVELVYVDAHTGARPSHAEWQGQVYAISGRSTKYDNFYDATQYGDIAGLKGINCTHNFYPYWDGDPVPKFKEASPVDVDGKEYTYYEAAQKQRKMERAIRDKKRELKALESLKDPSMSGAIDEAKRSLRQQVQKYNEFSSKAKIEPQIDRLRVYDSIAAAKQAKTAGIRSIKYDPTKSFASNEPTLAKEVNEGISKAAKELAEKSAKLKVEVSALVDVNTGIYYNESILEGFEGTVDVNREFLKKHPDQKFYFVHTHLTDGPVSVGDVDFMVREKQLDGVVAVRIDGEITMVETNGIKGDIMPSFIVSPQYEEAISKIYEEDEFCDAYIEEIIRPDVIEQFTKGEKVLNNGND